MRFLKGKYVTWACALLTGWMTQCVSGSVTPHFLAGCEPDYPPYCMVTSDGQASGFSVELLRASLKAMGHEVTFKTGPWPYLKQELSDGRIRVLPLVGRTPEREAVYDFTFPYLTMHGVIVIRNDTTGIQSPADLEGKRVAVLRGDNAEEFLHRVKLGAVIVPRPSFETALCELADGKHDAVVIQKLLAFQLMQKKGLKNLRTVGSPLKEFIQNFCFAVKKGDKDLLADLNEGLAIVMADGTFRALYAKWFTELKELGRTKTRIVIGGDANCPPYEFLDQNNQPAGFNVDLTRAIARHMELSVDIRLGSWDLIRKGLESGDIDVVQSMFYSAERDQAYDFSAPHTPQQYVIATRKGSPELSGMENLTGKTILVMAGDIMEDLARSKGYGTQLVTAVSQEEALRLLALGKHDCALVAKVPALYWIKKNGWHNLRVPSHPVLAAEYCYAVRSGNQSLLAQFSEGLAAAKETGDYRKIQSKWLTPYDPAGFNFRTVVAYLLAVALPLLFLLGIVLLWSRSLQRKVSERTRELHEEMSGHKRADERAQAALAETQRLLKDADSSRRALLSVIEDQKIAEDRLRNSEEKFRSLYDSMKEGVALHQLLYDSAGHAVDYVIESVNPAYETLVGLKASDVTGQKASTVYGKQPAPYLDVYAGVVESGKPVRFEILFEPIKKSF
ncbi:MAG: transporter substrate-binding domain-containing protein, partial [Kiritimatiellae bacterium]|nr:transporter substrate-binding domain-containing protein [Kiritimatiellia bacterium]